MNVYFSDSTFVQIPRSQILAKLAEFTDDRLKYLLIDKKTPSRVVVPSRPINRLTIWADERSFTSTEDGEEKDIRYYKQLIDAPDPETPLCKKLVEAYDAVVGTPAAPAGQLPDPIDET
jgi:hypothetical protein